MRDLKNAQFNSNNPMKNYYSLQEKIAELNRKMQRTEQQLIDCMARLSDIESVSK